MDVKQKLSILADAAKYDASCASSGSKRKNAGGIGNSEGNGICHSYTPDGRCVSLLKILFTNLCIFDCSYCVNRLSNDVKRAKFSVKEVVELTLDFYRRNYIEGLFLSSGIFQSPDRTMEELILVAKTLRVEHKFAGYIHLKAVAGASKELIQEAGLWADRLSANIELPTQNDLDMFAPAKNITEIKETMGQIKDKIVESRDESKHIKSAPSFARAGQSTQLIVGATESSDASILSTVSQLYSFYSLKRVYYTAYSPIVGSDPRLPAKSPPLIREHRLYQADWLLRFYGFHHTEILTPEKPNLDLQIDPKLSWALRNRQLFPVDINTAPQSMLLRVPGLGVRSVQRLLKLRRVKKIRWVDLSRMKMNLTTAKFFIVTADTLTHVSALDRVGFEQQFTAKPKVQTLFDFAIPEADTSHFAATANGEL